MAIGSLSRDEQIALGALALVALVALAVGAIRRPQSQPAPTPGGTMDPRAPAAVRALKDASERWPSRNKATDGIMGDARHQATTSDHNSGDAVDITHDPISGCHGDIIAGHACADGRVRYVIWRRRINSLDGRGWRPYQGASPHTSHVHISLVRSVRDDVSPWGWVDPERDASAILRADGELSVQGVKTIVSG